MALATIIATPIGKCHECNWSGAANPFIERSVFGKISPYCIFKHFLFIPQMFTFEYVEPYSNGSCHSYTNCLQCLSDSLCGWCDPSQRCLPRVIHRNMTSPDDILPECYLEGNTTAFLILNPLQCTNCSNHISCHHCVEDGLCEWLVDEASCTRRGRFANAVHSLNECPVPCHQRDNCAACLGEPGRCTWCEETQVIDFFYFQNMFRVY